MIIRTYVIPAEVILCAVRVYLVIGIIGIVLPACRDLIYVLTGR